MKYEDFLIGLRRCYNNGCYNGCCNKCPLSPAKYDAVCAAVRNVFDDDCCSIDDIEMICNAVKETE